MFHGSNTEATNQEEAQRDDPVNALATLRSNP
jgi:hypothetical protein